MTGEVGVESKGVDTRSVGVQSQQNKQTLGVGPSLRGH